VGSEEARAPVKGGADDSEDMLNPTVRDTRMTRKEDSAYRKKAWGAQKTRPPRTLKGIPAPACRALSHAVQRRRAAEAGSLSSAAAAATTTTTALLLLPLLPPPLLPPLLPPPP
jgi:hypothetical protein